MTTGAAFKIAAVPFHYWTPDAYQGSPTPITGYLSVGPKVGAFVLLIKLFVVALAPLATLWIPVLVVLAAATMTLGNLVALTQTNVKRMLAYSTIAHTGYLMVGLVAAGAGERAGTLLLDDQRRGCQRVHGGYGAEDHYSSRCRQAEIGGFICNVTAIELRLHDASPVELLV